VNKAIIFFICAPCLMNRGGGSKAGTVSETR